MRPDTIRRTHRPAHRLRRTIKVGTATFLITEADPRLKLIRAEDLDKVAAEMRQRAQA